MKKPKLKKLIFCALFAAMTAAGAFFRIPLGFSTITLQFFFTALAGMLLGKWWGAASQLLYVALGLAGVPVFASGGGPQYLLQPSCGFVLALPVTAFIIGALCYRRRDVKTVVLACLAGMAALYAVGIPYMALILNVYMDKGMSLWRILMAGMIPFLPGDFLKIAVCALIRKRLPEDIDSPSRAG